MLIRGRIRSEGKRADRRRPFYEQSLKQLRQRVLRGGASCEECGKTGLGLDPEHVFGRAGTGARLGWPWCDMPELLAGICRECHRRIDGQGQRSSELEWAAIFRFAIRGEAEGWLTAQERRGAMTELDNAGDPIDVIRLLVDMAIAHGGEPIVVQGRAA